MLGNIIVFGAALFIVLDRDSLNPSQVGLVISYAANITRVLNWLVQQVSMVENNSVSIERIKEYSELEQEAPWREVMPGVQGDWVRSGKITFER